MSERDRAIQGGAADAQATSAPLSVTATMVPVPIQRLPGGEGLPLPALATAGSAGADLRAALAAALVVAPGERVLIPTGFAIALPRR